MSSAPPMQRLKTPSQPLALATSLTMCCTAIGGQRRLRRRLPDHRVAADRRDHGVPGPDGDREIERRDDADRSQRLPLLDHAVPRPFAGDRQAVQLARQADGEVAHVDHFLDLAFTLGADLAGLERDQQPEVGLVGAQGRADLADDLAATGRRNHPPASERLARPRRRPARNPRPRPSGPAAAADRSPGFVEWISTSPVRSTPSPQQTPLIEFADSQPAQAGLRTWRVALPLRDDSERLAPYRSSYRRRRSNGRGSHRRCTRLIASARSTKMD